MITKQERFRGCLLGGAVGDALGYAVEFLPISRIHSIYGERGITDFDLKNGAALISDDTQMTLFTACGLLNGRTLGERFTYPEYIHRAYLDWLRTQSREGMEPDESCTCCTWLFRVPALNDPRAPGGTCLSALNSGKMGSVRNPINHSKGCGGVMRVAPIGLFFDPSSDRPAEEIDQIGAEAAAITHGHELGWLPAALMVRIINRIVYTDESDLEKLIGDALVSICSEYSEYAKLPVLRELVEKAIKLSHSGEDDLSCIQQLGEGWVAEETIAIAVYCALRYPADFESAVIAAVNHSGDSDSTGAVLGNILGAYLGVEAIPKKYLDTLEARDVITIMADDLLRRDGSPTDNRWASKYIFNNYSMG